MILQIRFDRALRGFCRHLLGVIGSSADAAGFIGFDSNKVRLFARVCRSFNGFRIVLNRMSYGFYRVLCRAMHKGEKGFAQH